jgi:formylmethanofuran dehydrogenase subunit E
MNLSFYDMTIDQVERDGYPTAEPVFKCDKCGKTIYEGNYYYAIGDETICEDCINDFREVAWL